MSDRMKSSVAIAFAAFACIAVVSPAAAQTAEALAAADRLIAAQDVEISMRDMATKLAATFPGTSEPQQRAFVTEMNAPAFLARYKTFLRISMAQNMSVNEMNAMAEFYSKPIAKSAMLKMGSVMAGIMPFMQTKIPGIAARVMKSP